jgi:hypothetical protein
MMLKWVSVGVLLGVFGWGLSAQTATPTPSVEAPLIVVSDGVLTVDDGTGVIVPPVWNEELDSVVYERVLYRDGSPFLVGRIDDGTDNFFFGFLGYRAEAGRTIPAGWSVGVELYPAARLLDIQVNADGVIAYLAVFEEREYHPEAYLGKPAVYAWNEGLYILTPPLETRLAPDGTTVYPVLEAFDASYTAPKDTDRGDFSSGLPSDDFATVLTVDGQRLTFGSRGTGLLGWETTQPGALAWDVPQERPFAPAVQADGEVFALAMNGGLARRVAAEAETEDGRSVRVFVVEYPDEAFYGEFYGLYWVVLEPLEVVRLAYWDNSVTEADFAILPDADGVLMSAIGNFGDGRGGAGVWRFAPSQAPVLLARNVRGGIVAAGLSAPPTFAEVNEEGFTLTGILSDGTPTRQRFTLDGTALD